MFRSAPAHKTLIFFTLPLLRPYFSRHLRTSFHEKGWQSQEQKRMRQQNSYELSSARKLQGPRLAALYLCASVLALLAGCSRKQSPPIDGAALFRQKCASCHNDDNDMRAPVPATLHQMSRGTILGALKSGRMKW